MILCFFVFTVFPRSLQRLNYAKETSELKSLHLSAKHIQVFNTEIVSNFSDEYEDHAGMPKNKKLQYLGVSLSFLGELIGVN